LPGQQIAGCRRTNSVVSINLATHIEGEKSGKIILYNKYSVPTNNILFKRQLLRGLSAGETFLPKTYETKVLYIFRKFDVLSLKYIYIFAFWKALKVVECQKKV